MRAVGGNVSPFISDYYYLHFSFPTSEYARPHISALLISHFREPTFSLVDSPSYMYISYFTNFSSEIYCALLFWGRCILLFY